ncbi:hypothetical protein RUND412_007591 [Rhizina undulata]
MHRKSEETETRLKDDQTAASLTEMQLNYEINDANLEMNTEARNPEEQPRTRCSSAMTDLTFPNSEIDPAESLLPNIAVRMINFELSDDGIIDYEDIDRDYNLQGDEKPEPSDKGSDEDMNSSKLGWSELTSFGNFPYPLLPNTEGTEDVLNLIRLLEVRVQGNVSEEVHWCYLKTFQELVPGFVANGSFKKSWRISRSYAQYGMMSAETTAFALQPLHSQSHARCVIVHGLISPENHGVYLNISLSPTDFDFYTPIPSIFNKLLNISHNYYEVMMKSIVVLQPKTTWIVFYATL